jgi:hypothetical protein
MLRTKLRKLLLENNSKILIDLILDKINTDGKQSLSYDELTYLDDYSSGNINNNLERWLLSDDEDTFNDEGKKLLYDEFEGDEDIFNNRNKLIRVINKHMDKQPFTNNADWGGAYVWNVNSKNNKLGYFLYLGDYDLVFLYRKLVDDGYNDEELINITTTDELYSFFKKLKNNT